MSWAMCKAGWLARPKTLKQKQLHSEGEIPSTLGNL